MMRKIFVLIAILFLILGISVSAYAALDSEAVEKADNIWSVANNASTVFQNQFDWVGTQPWIYINIKNIAKGDDWASSLRSQWFAPGTTTNPLVSDLWVKSGNDQAWLSISNWQDVKARGFEWIVNVDKKTGVNWNSQGTAKFVTPEPISSALFLLGGTVLAVRQYRKKRKA